MHTHQFLNFLRSEASRIEDVVAENLSEKPLSTHVTRMEAPHASIGDMWAFSFALNRFARQLVAEDIHSPQAIVRLLLEEGVFEARF